MMDKTAVSVYFLPNKKAERFEFPTIKEAFPFINGVKIKSRHFFSEFRDELKYVPLEIGKCSLCGVVGQKIISEDGREFIRKVNIRYDDTGHNKSPTHLNLDLLTIYLNANKKKNHQLQQTHLLNIKEKGIQTLHLLLQIPGSSVRRSVVVLPTLQDKTYHQKQYKFLEKLKSWQKKESGQEKIKIGKKLMN